MARAKCPELTVRSNNGPVQTSAVFEVFEPGTTTEAPIYSAATGGTALTQPVQVTAAAEIVFYAEAGLYDIRVTVGTETKTISNVQIGTAAGRDAYDDPDANGPAESLPSFGSWPNKATLDGFGTDGQGGVTWNGEPVGGAGGVHIGFDEPESGEFVWARGTASPADIAIVTRGGFGLTQSAFVGATLELEGRATPDWGLARSVELPGGYAGADAAGNGIVTLVDQQFNFVENVATVDSGNPGPSDLYLSAGPTALIVFNKSDIGSTAGVYTFLLSTYAPNGSITTLGANCVFCGASEDGGQIVIYDPNTSAYRVFDETASEVGSFPVSGLTNFDEPEVGSWLSIMAPYSGTLLLGYYKDTGFITRLAIVDYSDNSVVVDEAISFNGEELAPVFDNSKAMVCDDTAIRVYGATGTLESTTPLAGMYAAGHFDDVQGVAGVQVYDGTNNDIATYDLSTGDRIASVPIPAAASGLYRTIVDGYRGYGLGEPNSGQGIYFINFKAPSIAWDGNTEYASVTGALLTVATDLTPKRFDVLSYNPGVGEWEVVYSNAEALGLPTGELQVSPDASANSFDSGGDARGANAVNLQPARASADRVASGGSAVAIGENSKADGTHAVAIGESTNADGNDSVALGDAAQALANGDMAVGEGASATGGDSVALGRGAATTHGNSVALGSNASTTQINQVACGDKDLELQGMGRGFITQSPNGTRYKITVDDAGVVSAAAA